MPKRHLAPLMLAGLLALPAQAALYLDAGIELGPHANGATGALQMPEMMGAAVALFDSDGDGDLDLLLLDGAPLPLPERRAEGDAGLRLFRNLLVETGRLGFGDVTVRSGLNNAAYGMGVATGDFNSDGAVDLYFASFGPNQLWRNRGDGRFEDVTTQAGVADARWGAAASFVDIDRDGHLDLFLANYLDYDARRNKPCYAPSSRRDYCGPAAFKPLPNRLWRNRGDGRFEDASAAAGIAGTAGPSLGVVALDADGDGRMDLYVANDGAANELWRNRGDGRFEEVALLAGLALNADGRAEAGMGIALGDADGDGDEDLFLTHLDGETNTLYLNLGGGLFEDRTSRFGLAAPSLNVTGFGTAFTDVDHDGWLDLVAVNGAVRQLESLLAQGDSIALAQRKQLFRNAQGTRFEDWSARAGPSFAQAEVSRGLAIGDVDNDGDEDLLIGNSGGRFRLLLREGAPPQWLGLRLLAQGRDALGARVRLLREPGPDLLRRAASDGSYGAASDPRVRFALPQGHTPKALRVQWPDGARERFALPPGNAYHSLRQGSGAVDKDTP